MIWMTIELMRVVVTGPKELVSVATILAPQSLAKQFEESMAAVDAGAADPVEPYEIVEGFVDANYPGGWMAVDHDSHGNCLEAVTAAGVIEEGFLFYEDEE